MSQLLQSGIAPNRGRRAPSIEPVRCRISIDQNSLSAGFKQKLTIMSHSIHRGGIPQEFTLTTTSGGQRSCELFRGIFPKIYLRLSFKNKKIPGANRDIQGGWLWRYSA